MNFARLNHILIPTSKAERDRLRQSLAGRALLRAFSFVLTLTDEGIGALLLWLFALTFAINVGTTQFYYLWSALTGLLAASILWSRRYRLKNVSVDIHVPKRISVGETMTFQVSVRNAGDDDIHAVRIHLPFLPWDGTWQHRPEGFSWIASKQIGRKEASAVFSARGTHHLDLFYASALLPFGLSHGPAVQGLCPKFSVVPKIALVKSFSMPVVHRYQPGGVALASATGESRELIGVRPYRFGDPVRDIHAATWARVGEPQVREYRQEYFTRIGVVVDTDRTKCTEETFETALSLTAGLLSHLTRGEALVDLIVFGDEIHPLTLGRHLGFLDQALDLLADVRPGPPWSLETLERQVEPHLQRLSSVVFITLGQDEKYRDFEAFVLARNVGIRSLYVTTKPSKAAKDDARCTAVTSAEIEEAQEIFL